MIIVTVTAFVIIILLCISDRQFHHPAIISYPRKRGPMGGVCSSHVRKGFSHYGNVYPFHSFLGLNPTRIISEASNLITNFVLMLLIMLLSFVDWLGFVPHM